MAVQQISSVNKYTAESEMDAVTYKWTIRNFSHYMKKEGGFSLRSPIFSYRTEAKNKIMWYLTIFPNGKRKEKKNSVSLYLCPEDNAMFELTVLYRFYILNGRREPSYEFAASKNFSAPGDGHGCPKFLTTNMLKEKAKELLPNDSLTVYCEILHNPDNSENSAIQKVPKCCLGDNLSDLYKKQWLSDVTLTAQGEEFNAHKIILAARSKVFAAMFFSDMKEKTQNIVEIADMDKEVLRNLLHYIYSGEGPDDKTVPVMSDLLAAADKYDLERLKILCEKDLSLKLTIDNVVELLILADLHNAIELKSFALDFVNSELDEVMKTEVWMIFVRNHPCLLNEVLAYHLKRDREDMEN